jgi:malate dehydrogenase (quinone)
LASDSPRVLSYGNILADRVLLPYVLENPIYDLPVIGKRAFPPDIRKVVPNVDPDDIDARRGSAASGRRS